MISKEGLLDIVRRMLPPDVAFEGHTDFESLGFDSVDMLSLICEVEKAYAIRIPDESLSEMRNFDDLFVCVAGSKRSA